MSSENAHQSVLVNSIMRAYNCTALCCLNVTDLNPESKCAPVHLQHVSGFIFTSIPSSQSAHLELLTQGPFSVNCEFRDSGPFTSLLSDSTLRFDAKCKRLIGFNWISNTTHSVTRSITVHKASMTGFRLLLHVELVRDYHISTVQWDPNQDSAKRL